MKLTDEVTNLKPKAKTCKALDIHYPFENNSFQLEENSIFLQAIVTELNQNFDIGFQVNSKQQKTANLSV